MPVSTTFVSENSISIGMHTDGSRVTVNYSSNLSSTQYSFVATNHTSTFTWNGSFGNSHNEILNSFQFRNNVSGTDSFVFRSDLGRDTTNDVHSAPDLIQTGRSWAGDVFDAALVHITESFDLFTTHGEQSATALRQVSLTEIHAHQNDFHLV
jgi:hypothetical protein